MDPKIARALQAGGIAQREGDPVKATRSYEAVLAIDPDQPQALNSLGVLALARNDHAGAIGWLTRAVAADPGAAPVLMNLAKAHRLADDAEAERQALDRVLAIDATDFMAHVRKAELHERLGEHGQAVQRWVAVLAMAPALGKPAPALSQMLEHARDFVDARARMFSTAIGERLDEARTGLDRADSRRFDAAIDHLLGRRAIFANQCAGLFYPFLPAEEFFPRTLFPWFDALEARTSAIRTEFEQLIAARASAIAPYVSQSPGTPVNKWSALDNSLDWSAFYLWRYGERLGDACAQCPQTAAAIEAVPAAADVPGRAPSAFFSILKAGARIPPHTGVSNTRAIIHLPLVVPRGCGFRVGGETRAWREGEAFGFDDTIEHEAWNESPHARAVLIFDVWNPYLSDAERQLLKVFYTAADQSGHNPDPR